MGKKLKEIFEIMDDINREIDDNAFSSIFNIGNTYGTPDKNTNVIAVIKTFFPDILGFLLGLSFTRLFGLGGIVYLVMGIVFSIGFAVFYTVKFRRKTLKYALKRHILIVGGIALIFGIVYIFCEK